MSPASATRGEEGQSTVEFALVLPVLLIVVLLFVQSVMVLHAQLVVTGAAREAARRGVETASEAEIRGVAMRAAAGLSADRLDITIDSGPRVRGEWIKVGVSYEVPLVLPAIEKLFPDQLRVEGKASMRIENDHEDSAL